MLTITWVKILERGQVLKPGSSTYKIQATVYILIKKKADFTSLSSKAIDHNFISEQLT